MLCNTRHTRPLTTLLVACLLAYSATATHARSLWLLPSGTTLTAADKWVTVDFGKSTAPFESSQEGMSMDNLRITAPDGTAVEPHNLLKGALRGVFDVPLAQRGTYRMTLVFDSLFARWKDAQTGNNGYWRGTSKEEFAQKVPANGKDMQAGQLLYRVEAFVTVGAPTKVPTGPAADSHAGQGLEMLPVTHPNDLVADEAAQFAFLLNGQPAPDLEILVTSGGFHWRDSANVQRLKTDAQGKVTVRWPAPGMYLINASAEDDKGPLPQARQRRLTYAGTVEVLP